MSELSRLENSSPIPLGQFGKWDVYPLIWQETARLSDRRQSANALYVSVNSLLIGGIAFLAQQSQLESYTLLIVQGVAAIVGFLITREWHKLLEVYRRLLNLRIDTLKTIEQMPDFPGAVGMFVIESEHPHVFGFSKIEQSIPVLFLWLYVIGILLLVAGTFAVKTGFTNLLGHLLHLPHF